MYKKNLAHKLTLLFIINFFILEGEGRGNYSQFEVIFRSIFKDAIDF